jgi:hypothetical protein
MDGWGYNEAAFMEDAQKQKRSEVATQAYSISLRSSASESEVAVRGRRVNEKALDPKMGV